jgi:hypothetical protein
MATFTTLTSTQQAQVIAWMPLFRSSVIQLAQACNQGASLDSVWQNTILAIVTSLDAGTIIPDVTGLAGASPLVREDVLGMMAAIEALLSSANTTAQQAEYVKVVGPANAIG